MTARLFPDMLCGSRIKASRKGGTVKRKIVMALGLGVSALALSACGTTMPVEVRMTRDAQAAPPPQTSFAGTYLAANFAASE